MRKSVLLLSLTLCICVCSAQKSKLKSYYYWVNQAELAMCDTNWDKVNLCYDSAFAIHKPYQMDLFRAFTINMTYSKDKERVLKYAHDMLTCGDFEIAIRYKSQHKTDTLTYETLKLMEDTTKIICDTTLMRLLDTVIKVDQEYHYLKVSPKEHRKAYRRNKQLIISLFRHYPEISIYSAGFYFDHNLSTPCIHYLQAKDYTIHRIMKRRVLKGKFDPTKYISIEEFARGCFTSNTKYGQNAFYKVGNVLFYTEPNNIKQINKSRHRIGIEESFEDYVKKVLWQYNTGKLFIHTVTNLRTDNDEEEIARTKAEIDKEHQKGNYKRNYYIISQ